MARGSAEVSAALSHQHFTESINLSDHWGAKIERECRGKVTHICPAVALDRRSTDVNSRFDRFLDSSFFNCMDSMASFFCPRIHPYIATCWIANCGLMSMVVEGSTLTLQVFPPIYLSWQTWIWMFQLPHQYRIVDAELKQQQWSRYFTQYSSTKLDHLQVLINELIVGR